HLDPARRRHAEKAKAKQPTKLSNSPVAFSATTARRGAHRKPYLVACRCPIDTLKHKFEIEAELQLTNDHHRRRIATQGNKIATSDFALHLEAEILEKAFNRPIKRSLQRTTCPFSCFSLAEAARDRRSRWPSMIAASALELPPPVLHGYNN